MQVRRIFTGFALSLLAAAIAQATPVAITSYSCSDVSCNSTSWSQFSPTVGGTTTFDGTLVPNASFFTTALGGTDYVEVTFQDSAVDGAIYEENGGAPDGFLGGTNVYTSSELLLSTNINNSATSYTPDALTLTFTNPVSEFGIVVDDEDYEDPFYVTLSTTSDGGASDTVLSPGGVGTAVFVGLMDTSADITNITIHTTCGQAGGCSSTNHGTPDYFMLGTAQFDEGQPQQQQPTPEPASMLMMAGGAAVLAWKLRKRARRA